MTGAELTTIATAPTRMQVDLMAHALGFPSVGSGLAPPRGEPYRNGYCADSSDDWDALVAMGLARCGGRSSLRGGMTVWNVTPLGESVTRLRLAAARLVRRGFV